MAAYLTAIVLPFSPACLPPGPPYALKRPVVAGDAAAQARAFDLLHNLSVHGELLYDGAAEAVPKDAPALADAGEVLSKDEGLLIEL